MYREAVEYKPGHWLAPGSEALELYKAKKFKELEALLKQTTLLGVNWRDDK
jgi:hypothetical protein